MLRSVCLLVCAAALPAAAASRVALLTDGVLAPPAQHGIARLRASLEAKGIAIGQPADLTILAGAGTTGRAARTLAALKVPLPRTPEALVIRHTTLQGKPALVLWGSNASGLMYAALETAAATPEAVRDTAEQPYLAERGVSIYTMQRAWFESRLYDEKHWRRYFDLLAASRINTFTVIFGYENGGFLAPVYPYLFDVPGFPGVRMVGLTAAQQQRNTAAFRTMARIAHERGIQVIAAIWDHIYRGGVQGGGIEGASDTVGKDVPGLVSGVTSENLNAYTKGALRRFVDVFPGIDGLEFRMHNESGLKREEMGSFWHDVFGILAKAKPGMLVTLRAKELPDSIIDDALAQGLKARIETKYWMEQMGLPFHPTHINRQNQKDRRHGYADLLRYPQRYQVHWRLWSGGATRLLLWADPEYVRRFAQSARLYGGTSFDVNEMLATKMLGEPHARIPIPIFTEKYRFSDYEFERYWHFFQVWGRVSYNPSTPAAVWERDFAARFGKAGPHLMQGIHTASRVVPRIVAASYRYQLFPTTRGWAEMMREGDLPQYADLEGTDIEQFMNPRDAAKATLAGAPTSKRRPEETSRWFEDTAAAVMKHVRAAEEAGASGKEAVTTLADLRILAGLARYHAARLPGAVQYNLYRASRDRHALDFAIAQECVAIAEWSKIVKAAGDIYSPDLGFGVHRVGFPRHWSEELEKLKAGLEVLEKEGDRARPDAPKPPAARDIPSPPVVRLEPAGRARPGQDLRITVRAQDPDRIQSLRLRYRHLTQFEDYLTADMASGPNGTYTATIPGAFIIPTWDVMYFVEAIGTNGGGRNYPDLEVEAPYVIVPVERR
jgi:hypothetical protein